MFSTYLGACFSQKSSSEVLYLIVAKRRKAPPSGKKAHGPQKKEAHQHKELEYGGWKGGRGNHNTKPGHPERQTWVEQSHVHSKGES